HHCPMCYKQGEHDICSDCIYWQKQGKVVNHQALYCYNSGMKEYFSNYKFQGDYLLRKVFQNDLKLALKSYRDYTLVPIPLSEQREAERGFNQVIGLLDGLGVPYQELLTKREVKKQSDKSRLERLQSQNPFELRIDKVLPDKILLIDDIYTTGMTLQLAAQLFYEKEVKEIKTFSLAR
ncbi:ComF family protein, partial [Streptococcus sp. S784/96/1]